MLLIIAVFPLVIHSHSIEGAEVLPCARQSRSTVELALTTSSSSRVVTSIEAASVDSARPSVTQNNQ